MDDIVFVVIENNKIIQMDHVMQFGIDYTTMITVREYEELFKKQTMNQNEELENDDDNN